MVLPISIPNYISRVYHPIQIPAAVTNIPFKYELSCQYLKAGCPPITRKALVSEASCRTLGEAGSTKQATFAEPGVVTTPKVSEPWTVEKVLAQIHPETPAEGSSSPVPFFHILERLKTGKREGWRRFGINR